MTNSKFGIVKEMLFFNCTYTFLPEFLFYYYFFLILTHISSVPLCLPPSLPPPAFPPHLQRMTAKLGGRLSWQQQTGSRRLQMRCGAEKQAHFWEILKWLCEASLPAPLTSGRSLRAPSWQSRMALTDSWYVSRWVPLLSITSTMTTWLE